MFNLITNDQEIQTAIEKFQKRNFLHGKGERCLLTNKHTPVEKKWG